MSAIAEMLRRLSHSKRYELAGDFETLLKVARGEALDEHQQMHGLELAPETVRLLGRLIDDLKAVG
jgi:hypothetical protein